MGLCWLSGGPNGTPYKRNAGGLCQKRYDDGAEVGVRLFEEGGRAVSQRRQVSSRNWKKQGHTSSWNPQKELGPANTSISEKLT